MKHQLITIASAVGIFAASCATAQTTNYTVTLPLTEDEDGLMAYITNFDTGAKIDSVMVDDGKAVFSGNISTPVFSRIILDGNRMGMLILEPGQITIDTGKKVGTGTILNDRFNELLNTQAELVKSYRSLSAEEAAEKKSAIIEEYNAVTDRVMEDNIKNALGYYLFLQKVYEWDLATLDANLEKCPQFANSHKINTLRQGLINKESTSAGHPYKDFEVTYNGETKRLSDYVGKGRYTLVDFWASWCGPCIRETAVIKKLYNDYKDKGLDVLGVAVWDEPQNTLKAIEKHELPWPQIINAQTIPTDLYGIPAIPCIILFDPQGNIVSRDKQDDALVNDVAAALEGFVVPE